MNHTNYNAELESFDVEQEEIERIMSRFAKLSGGAKRSRIFNEISSIVKRNNLQQIEDWSHINTESLSRNAGVKTWELEVFLKELIKNELEIRKSIINQINIVKLKSGVETIDDWEHINANELPDATEVPNWELESFLKDLIEFVNSNVLQAEEHYRFEQGKKEEFIDSLALINKYKNGNLHAEEHVVPDVYVIKDVEWVHFLSDQIKKEIPTWKKDGIDLFYKKVKELMQSESGLFQTDLKILLAKLSEVIDNRDQFNSNIEIERTVIDVTSEDDDKIAEMILFRVEQIVLPHIEVIEKNIKSGGRLKFADIWEIPFKEELKIMVRERDGYKCAVCEGEMDLHVHHKIPRNLGGVHHVDNLVTLCGSCHGTIEQADVSKALVKCLSNYRKNKAMKSINWDLPVSKGQLKSQIEERLDSLLNQLTRKDAELSKEVVEIITRFEQLMQL